MRRRRGESNLPFRILRRIKVDDRVEGRAIKYIGSKSTDQDINIRASIEKITSTSTIESINTTDSEQLVVIGTTHRLSLLAKAKAALKPLHLSNAMTSTR